MTDRNVILSVHFTTGCEKRLTTLKHILTLIEFKDLVHSRLFYISYNTYNVHICTNFKEWCF